MHAPRHLWRARFAAIVTGGALVAALFPMAGTALAAVAITGVTNGGSISADTASVLPGTGAWTSLGGPIVSEGAAGDIPASGTVTLTVPAGFELRTGVTVTAGMSVAAGVACGVTVSSPAVLTSSTAQVTLGGTATTGADRCRLTFGGLQVRPTSGTLPNTGSLTFSGAISGSAGTLTMVAGDPILAFSQQPSAAGFGGVALAQQPKVSVADRFGNVPAGNVLLSVNTGPSGGALTCTTNPVTPVAGVATFAGCALDRAGNYTLRASLGSGSAVSTPITISAGAPAKLVFYQQPTLGVAGVAFPAQPYVAVADAGGNILTSGSYTVSLAISSNPGAGTLTCTSGTSVGTQLTSAGVIAQFSGCRINNAGLGYTLSASTGGLASALSGSFDIENQLAFWIQPAGAIAGAAFTTQPAVAVQVNGAPATHDNTTVVTLGIRPGTGAAGATLTCSGGLTRTVITGVASFSGCAIDKVSPAGSPYQLVASTTTGLGSVFSAAFAVTTGPAVKLAFTTQPAGAGVAAPFPVAPVVAVQDAGGNTISTSVTMVTLALGANPGGGTLSCPGGLTRVTSSGMATFAGCSIDRQGAGYTLVATATSLASATSSPFNVLAPAAAITLVRSHGMITLGDTLVLSLQFAAGGAGRTVYVDQAITGVPWRPIATLTTSGSGFASLSFRPTRTGYYRIRFDGATDLTAATSNVLLVGVRQTVALSPSFSGTRTIARGSTITFRTTVRPQRPDVVASRVFFQLWERSGGRWVLRTTQPVLTDSAGVASTSFRFGSRGSWYVRAYAERTPFNSISRFTARATYFVP